MAGNRSRFSVDAIPMRTLVTLAALAGVVWVNAIVNPYRFNVVLGLLASVPALWVLVAGAVPRRS